MNKTNRRSFLKIYGTVAAGTLVVPTIIPACARGKNGHTAPSDRVNMAFIGAGNQAGNDVKEFLKDKRVQVVTVCDVNKESSGYWNGKVAGREFIKRLVNESYTEQYGKPYNSCIVAEDFREVIQNKDIDVVEVVTPDHWHAIPVLMAAAAGKDIYCQKPLSLTISEGRAMVNAVEKYNIIFQTGSQRRSSSAFRKICELVRNGKLGELHTVKVGLPNGTPDYGKTGNLTEIIPVPEGFDYNTWLGPAPDAPYSPARTHVNYRWNLDYSGGQLTDWGGHFIDMAQWGMGTDDTGPIKIQNAKAKWAEHPVWNTAIEFYFEAIYANGVKLIVSTDEQVGVKFEGSEGSIWQNGANPESLLETRIGRNDIHLYDSNASHYQNFIDCVLSREITAAPAEVGHRSISIAHLGNIAMLLKQDLNWNPEKEEFVDNLLAQQMLKREMREPWRELYQKYEV
jgi:predicted dehydrogenase